MRDVPVRFDGSAARGGWLIATVASVTSLFVTAQADLPIGAAIVCMLGVFLILAVAAARLLGVGKGAPN